jgi:hypothetical protein
VSARGAAWLGALATIVLVSGCAVQRIDHGVYHSPKGYRVEIPGGEWAPVRDSPADVEFRHRVTPAGMAANASCEPATARRPARALAQQLFIGVRERQVIERGERPVAGRPAVHTVLEGRLEGSGDRVRIETLVLKDDRCVYDLMYAASPAAFAELRADFARFVESFGTDHAP